MPSAAAPEARDQQVRRVLLVILLLNLVVVAIKFGVGVGTRSLAVFGDALQASLDAVTNVLGLAIVAVAAKGPDAEHPYGHAKFETLGALIIVVFLSVSLFELLRGAVVRLLQGTPAPTATPTQFGLLVATLLINVMVTLYESREGHRLDSELLLADAEHTRMDVLITVAVIGGLGLSQLGLAWADPVLAVLVAAFVARAGYAIVRRAIPTLVDQAVYEADRIRERAVEVPGVTSAYGIRSRAAAQTRFAELTIAVNGASDVTSAHQIADAVEQHLKDTLELHEVMVHVEPC